MSFLEIMLKKIPGNKYYTADRRKRDISRMYKDCAQRKHTTKWESTFVRSIEGKTFLTDKQFSKLKEIYQSADRPRVRGHLRHAVMCDDTWSKVDPRYCDKHSVSWDEVHDFDKD